MNRLMWLFLLLLLPCRLEAQGTKKDPVLQQALALERTIEQSIARAEPGIACILISRSDPSRTKVLDKSNPLDLELEASKLDLSHPQAVPESFGSGVVVDPRGLIVTNYHVVKDAHRIFVRLNNHRSGYAEIHAADPRSDLAILKIQNEKLLPMAIVPRGNASLLKRGQFVISLANPFAAGFRDGQPSASWGILSNIRRRSLGTGGKEVDRARPLHHYGTLLQTDARLNLGCSGGALLNLEGELVGLTTALAAIHGGETPGGFAIPIDTGMSRILDVLLQGEEVDYGFLGVGFENRNPSQGSGVRLSMITPGSPAELDAHLRPGDVIVGLNGQPIQDSDDMFLWLGTQLAGTRIKLEIRRGFGAALTAEATLAKFYVPGKKISTSLGKRPFVHGLRVDYTSLLVQQPHATQRIPEGVVISDVQTKSAAAMANLKVGDIISQVNGQTVTNPEAFYRAINAAGGKRELTLGGLSPQDPRYTVRLQ